MDIYEWLRESEQDTLLQVEDWLRSNEMNGRKMYRAWAGDKRVWSQIRRVSPMICQECGQPIDIRMELVVDGKHEACAKKEQTR